MDRTTRRAALWATLVALPLTVLLVLFLAGQVAPRGGDPSPAAGTGTPAGAAPPAGGDTSTGDPSTGSPSADGPGSPSVAPVPAAPVPMTAAALTERQAVVCRAFLSRLPAAVRHLAQRPV